MPGPTQDEIDGLLPQTVCEAVELLSGNDDVSSISIRVGGHWRQRATKRLADRLERYYCPKLIMPTGEQAAYGMIKDIAHQLERAATALDVAARALKDKGLGPQAVQAHMAAQQAHSTAKGLLQ